MPGEPAFDEIIHAPIRLRLCGLLRHVDEAEFAALRDTLAISDASLSKHLKVLVDAGYATTRKSRSPSRDDDRRLTWVRETRSGRRAFDAHVAELHRIAAGPSDVPGGDPLQTPAGGSVPGPGALEAPRG